MPVVGVAVDGEVQLQPRAVLVAWRVLSSLPVISSSGRPLVVVVVARVARVWCVLKGWKGGIHMIEVWWYVVVRHTICRGEAVY